MNFIEHFFANLEQHAYRPLITEVHRARLAPTSGAGLAALVAQARGGLRAHGVRPGDRAALLAPNSARWVATDLAMLAEGAIVVPMYARQDPDELVEMMRDCAPTIVVCASEALAGAVRERWAEAPVVTLDALLDAEPVALDAPLAPRDGEATATIIYTSGTSGVAKGVELSVANIDFMMARICEAITGLLGERGMSERVFHYLPFCFAGSRMVLWMCLMRGRNLMVSTDLNQLVTEMGAAAPQYFLNVPRVLERIKAGVEARLRGQPRAARWLYEQGARSYQASLEGRARMPQRALYEAARRLVFDRIRRQIGPNLECLLCGSAPLGEETQRWFAMIGVPVYQIYGLTETTAIVTMDRPQESAPGHVGHPIEGVEARLGEGDELQVRGPNVFKGYWERPAETREAFTDDGWLRTGDQAVIEGDGNLRIIGRVKNLLVPTSGHNVAPEPIEQRLVEQIEGAEQAVVFGHGRPCLVALVTGAVSEQAAAAGVEQVNATLPHYRRVRAVHVTPEALTPESGLLTANMKLRRRAIEARYARELDALYARQSER